MENDRALVGDVVNVRRQFPVGVADAGTQIPQRVARLLHTPAVARTGRISIGVDESVVGRPRVAVLQAKESVGAIKQVDLPVKLGVGGNFESRRQRQLRALGDIERQIIRSPGIGYCNMLVNFRFEQPGADHAAPLRQ